MKIIKSCYFYKKIKNDNFGYILILQIFISDYIKKLNYLDNHSSSSVAMNFSCSLILSQSILNYKQ
jgi:hypothetical protein